MYGDIVILSGAGISAESGIPTFRDSDGLWENYPVEEVASIEGWGRNPGLMLDFYNERRRQLSECSPNEAHRIIASLEKHYRTDVITQNVDNLHERAGSTHVLHLHGELTKVRPENSYNERDGFSTDKVFDIGYEPVHLGDKAPNGAQLRPHIDIDAELTFKEITPRFVNTLKRFEPFGPGNPKPTFCTRRVYDHNDGSKIVGQGGEHLKLELVDGSGDSVMNGIAFRMGRYCKELKSFTPVDICYTIEENTFNGFTSTQLMIRDIKKSE